MKGFLLGLLVAGLGIGGYFYWQHLQPRRPAPCACRGRGRTDDNKKARSAIAAPFAWRAVPPPAIPWRRRARAEPVRLSAADLRPVAQGDDLSKPDVLRLDMSNDKELPELSQDQIDERFRGQESAILDCIARARPDPETYVPGRVTIKFRIQRAGTVRGVRVEGPAVLQRNGLYGCIKAVVVGIRFPSAGTSQIISYPFTLS
jgi:hypothetical protein